MNERIRELATEVGISVDYLENTKQIVLIEKFAKLIIQECAEIAACNAHVSGFAFGDLVREHFGVKE